MPLARWMAETEEPVRLAMADRESPALTTYRVDLGLTLTGTDFGLVFGLTATGSGFSTVFFGLVVTSVLEMTGAGLERFAGGRGFESGGGSSFLAISGKASGFASVEVELPPCLPHLDGSSAKSSR